VITLKLHQVDLDLSCENKAIAVLDKSGRNREKEKESSEFFEIAKRIFSTYYLR